LRSSAGRQEADFAVDGTKIDDDTSVDPLPSMSAISAELNAVGQGLRQVS
jgi:hypothetical protein